MLADNLNIEILIMDKLTQNSAKFPIEKSYGTNLKYTEFQNVREN